MDYKPIIGDMAEGKFNRSSRIFNELANCIQERLNLTNKLTHLDGMAPDYLRIMLRSIQYEKQREINRCRTEDELINEIAMTRSLDKSLKQALTHFSFDVVEMLQPQLTFRLERHYVNLGKLYTAYFQAAGSNEDSQKILFIANSTNFTFKLQFYIHLLRLLFQQTRQDLSKAFREASSQILNTVRQERSNNAYMKYMPSPIKADSASFSLIVPKPTHAIYTGRQRHRKRRIEKRRNATLNIAEDSQIKSIERKLAEIGEICSTIPSGLCYPKANLKANTMLVQGGRPSTPKATRKSEVKESSIRYDDIGTKQPTTETERESTKDTAVVRRKSERTKNYSEVKKVDNTVELPKLAQVIQLQFSPTKYTKNRKQEREYGLFMELYASNIQNQSLSAIQDLEVVRDRKRKLCIDREQWLSDNMDSVVTACLSQNNSIGADIVRYSQQYVKATGKRIKRAVPMSRTVNSLLPYTKQWRI